MPAPLNDRLLYIDENGKRIESAIDEAVEDRRYRLADWDARPYIEAKVDGELQLYHGRKMIRDLGDTTVSDMLADKAQESLRKAREHHGEGYLKNVYDIAIGAPVSSYAEAAE